MNAIHLTARRLMLVLAVLGLGTGASCSLTDDRAIDFAFTGRVLDADTKEPIEGAFVLAVYKKVDLGMAASAEYCVKTKGMVTGKDGEYSFPIERLDSVSPDIAYAIKADYYLKGFEDIPIRVQKKNNKESYSNRNVYLKRQDPAKPEFRTTFNSCQRPESREAVDAGIRYLELMLVELRKYSKFSTAPHEETIKQMQLVPEKPASSKR